MKQKLNFSPYKEFVQGICYSLLNKDYSKFFEDDYDYFILVRNVGICFYLLKISSVDVACSYFNIIKQPGFDFGLIVDAIDFRNDLVNEVSSSYVLEVLKSFKL